jgi:hypothetical protein
MPSQGVMSYTLYAVIDPDHASPNVTEDVENNNTVSRTIQVLPCDVEDDVAPHPDAFEIEGGRSVVYQTDVSLDVEVSDLAPQDVTPVGVEQLYFVEFLFNESTGVWTPVKGSGWLPVDNPGQSITQRTPWQLYPQGGLRFIQAWAADANANISRLPYQKKVSYVQPCDAVARYGSQTYSVGLKTGDTLATLVTPCSGDPDLYIWPPDWKDEQGTEGRPPWVSNRYHQAEEYISFEAPISGTYQIQVYGYTNNTEYNINIEHQPTQTVTSRVMAEMLSAQTVMSETDKPKPTEPSISGSPTFFEGSPPEPAPFVESTEESGTLDGVMIDGPATGSINTTYTYTATVLPLGAGTVGWPITYTWEATGQDQKVHPSGSISSTDTVTFTWSSASPATKTITVTVADGSGSPVSDNHETVITAHNIYLPLVIRNS